jgi:hypothetical protein
MGRRRFLDYGTRAGNVLTHNQQAGGFHFVGHKLEEKYLFKIIQGFFVTSCERLSSHGLGDR